MLKETKQTFNGADTNETYIDKIYDKIEYCPFCGKKLPTPTNEIRYCTFCGKEIPRTYTSPCLPYIIHWNYPDGTITYPRDGVTYPIFTC